jgi:hypothetical protein
MILMVENKVHYQLSACSLGEFAFYLLLDLKGLEQVKKYSQ